MYATCPICPPQQPPVLTCCLYLAAASPPRRERSRSRGGDGWRARLDRLVADGTIGEKELDSSVFEELDKMKAADADACVERFAEANLSRINKKSNFLLGA